jgi:hypothetical protein
MAQATTTTPGTILLAGDLIGSAVAPSITPTGVNEISTPDTLYRKIYIDSKGRLVWVSPDKLTSPVIQNASTSVWGIIKPGDGVNIDSNHVISVSTSFANPSNDATTSVKGILKAGTNVSVTAGVISIPNATNSNLGVVSAGSNISISSGTISVATATTSNLGVVSTGTNITNTAGVISIPLASTSVKGLAQIGTGLNVNAGIVSFVASEIPLATTSSLGTIQVGSGLQVSAGTVGVNTSSFPIASLTTKGIAQIGTGLSVTDGVLFVSPSDASAGNRGFAQIGVGLDVSDGVISAPSATPTSLGIVQAGVGFNADNGTISVNPPIATTSAIGMVKVGNYLSVSSGSISTTSIATGSTYGMIKVGAGLNVNNGVLSTSNVADATYSSVGTIKVNPTYGLTVDTTGLLTHDSSDFLKDRQGPICQKILSSASRAGEIYWNAYWSGNYPIISIYRPDDPVDYTYVIPDKNYYLLSGSDVGRSLWFDVFRPGEIYFVFSRVAQTTGYQVKWPMVYEMYQGTLQNVTHPPIFPTYPTGFTKNGVESFFSNTLYNATMGFTILSNGVKTYFFPD